MCSLIEISIYGELFFFSNTLTANEYKQLCEFTKDYFKSKKITSVYVNINDFINCFFQTYKIQLHQFYIDKVISI